MPRSVCAVVLGCRTLCSVSVLCARTVLHWLCAEGLAVRQGKVEAMGYEKQQNLMRNVANLRGLVRIKIEDNGDLALAKKALIDARLVFDNVWALAFELPAVSDLPSVSRHAPWRCSGTEHAGLGGRRQWMALQQRRRRGRRHRGACSWGMEVLTMSSLSSPLG